MTLTLDGITRTDVLLDLVLEANNLPADAAPTREVTEQVQFYIDLDARMVAKQGDALFADDLEALVVLGDEGTIGTEAQDALADLFARHEARRLSDQEFDYVALRRSPKGLIGEALIDSLEESGLLSDEDAYSFSEV